MNCKVIVYAKNETDLPCLIGPSEVYDENRIGQWRHQSLGLVYDESETELLKPI